MLKEVSLQLAGLASIKGAHHSRFGEQAYCGDSSGRGGTRSKGLGCGCAHIGDPSLLGDWALAAGAGADAPFFLFLLAMGASMARVDDEFLPGAMGGALVGLAFGVGATADTLGMTVGGGDLAVVD
jgi:hypothetical protein